MNSGVNYILNTKKHTPAGWLDTLKGMAMNRKQWMSS